MKPPHYGGADERQKRVYGTVDIWNCSGQGIQKMKHFESFLVSEIGGGSRPGLPGLDHWSDFQS